MLNSQELYTHIRLHSDTCFLHVAYELILDTLYPEIQAKMIQWRDTRNMTFPTVKLK